MIVFTNILLLKDKIRDINYVPPILVRYRIMKKIFIIGLYLTFASIAFIARGETPNDAAIDSLAQEKVILELDSLINLAKENSDVESEASLYQKKGEYLLKYIYYSEALDAFQKSYALIDSVDDVNFKYSINLDLGMCYSFLALLQNALPYYDAAYAYADSTGNPLFIARAQHFAATKDLVTGEFVEAARKLYKSYQVLSEYNDTTHLLYTCSDIGGFFFFIGNSERAIDFSQKALHYDSLANTRETSFRAMILANIGAAYTDNLKDYSTAEKYFKESLASLRPRESWKDKFNTETSLATTQTYIGNYREALKYFENAYNSEQVKEHLDFYSTIVTYYGINLFKLGYYQKARTISNQAYKLSKELKSWQMVQMASENLYKLDSIEGNYRGALAHYREMIQAQRSKMVEDGKMEFVRLEVEQEIEKLASEHDELVAANEEYLGTIDKLNKLTFQQKLVIILFVLLAMALSIELVRNKRLTRRLKQSEEALKLLNQNLEAKVKQRTKALEKANLELHQLDDAKTEFLNIISHEIRTPLNGIVGILGLLDAKELPENLREFLKIIQISSDRLESFSYKALDISQLAARGKESLHFNEGNLITTLKHCCQEAKKRLNQKEMEIVGHFNSSEIILNYDELFFQKAFCHVIDNAVHFANEKTQISVALKKKDNTYEIAITDIGERFPDNSEEIEIRPFKTGQKHVDLNPGLSLYLSKLIMVAHGGNLVLNNNQDGVTVRMILPAE